jgi:hypothetical protein
MGNGDGTTEQPKKQQKGEKMKEPNGTDLLKILIDLYAEQEGVKIKYSIKEKSK